MYDPSLVTNEVLLILRTAEDDDVPVEVRRVGDGDGPDDRTRPYGVLHVITEPPADGDMGDPASMGELVVQVSSTGDSRESAQLHQWWMRQLLLAKDPTTGAYRHPIVGDGWKVYSREHDGSGGVDREGDTSPLFTAADRFRLGVTKAPALG